MKIIIKKILIFQDQSPSGFTLIEVLISLVILVILFSVAVPIFRFFQKSSDLDSDSFKIINVLREARSKTLACEDDSQYGVYFDVSGSPDQYTLFKGVNYVSRDALSDRIFEVSKDVEIYDISLNGGNEVVFNKVLGTASQSGNIFLRLIDEPAKTRNIYVESSGLISTVLSATSSDNGTRDSRHIHIDYNARFIDTATENIVLDFSGGVASETIVLADNMKDGQIYWEGEVDVGGDEQKIKIHTHALNESGNYTQFCVHRDRRYNNKSLSITISGDGTGSLINYSADGVTVNYSSSYVNNVIWQ